MDIVVTTHPDYRASRQPDIGKTSSAGDSYNSHNRYFKSPSNTCRNPKSKKGSFPGPAVVIHDFEASDLPPGEWVVLTYDRFLKLRYTYVER